MPTSLLLIVVLLALSASFSALETALFSLSALEWYRLRTGSGLSSWITKILERPREILTTILFGNELVNVAISILAGSVAYGLMAGQNPRWVYLVAISITTFFLLVFGEIVPKNVAIRNSVIVSQLLILPYRFFFWLTTPFRKPLVQFTDFLVHRFGGDPEKGRMIVEEELKTLLEMGQHQGTLADLERTLIRNALDFSEVPIAEIMTPRQKIIAIPEDWSLKKILDFLFGNRFSRLPVYRHNLDQITGILIAKELVPLRLVPAGERKIQEILKPFAVVTERQPLSQVFEEFRSRRIHMGIVIDQKGATLGLVTMDDLLRRLFP